ncbi:MAG TPA: TIGR03067 domain-containing protein [Gemmataceae bacterium]|nr:TIGR03067 domain-containing protein [Gemmataceae bacterium]
METLLLDLDLAREAAARKDRDRLQGTWNFVSGIREAQMLIAGDHFTVKFTSGDIYLGTFTLDPTSKPRMMDMTISEGPAKHRGKTSLIIYELDGDHLIWCPAEPGTGNRLRSFPPEEDTRHLCIIFRREKQRLVSSGSSRESQTRSF